MMETEPIVSNVAPPAEIATEDIRNAKAVKKKGPNKLGSTRAAPPVANDLGELAGKSVDSQVQHTNDDSVVSKRSAGRMGYANDDYLRYFVKKVARRSPLINRGYYLRILAMTRLVQDTIRLMSTVADGNNKSDPPPPPRRVQVISLGAGFDTLAARCYEMPEFSAVHWYEVDFPDVIRNKTQLMTAAPMSAFPFRAAHVRNGGGGGGSEEVVADRYAAVGLDLRDTTTELVPLLARSSVGGDFSVDAPTIIYAECVMQYMSKDCSDSVIRWVASTFPQAVFFAYDQLHPLDSFGRTMTSSLKSKQSPLLGVYSLSGGLELSRRALHEGIPFVRFANFYKMSRFLFDEQELARQDTIEAFDEVEEWCEMCEHYGILCGATTVPLGTSLMERWSSGAETAATGDNPFEDYCANASSSDETPPNGTRDLVASSWPTGRCAIEGWGFGGVGNLDLHRAPGGMGRGGDRTGDVVFIAFGGLLSAKGQSRSNALLVHSLCLGDIPVKTRCSSSSSAALPALVFHTFHEMGENHFLVIGGRTNPSDASNRVFEFVVSVEEYPNSVECSWSELDAPEKNDGLPCPRFRHTAVALRSSPTSGACRRVFVFGGRDGKGKTLGDAWLLNYSPGGTPDAPCASISWSSVPSAQLDGIPPLHSSAAVAVGSSTVLLSGGALSLHDSTNRMWSIELAPPLVDGTGAVSAKVTLSRVNIGARRLSHTMILLNDPPGWFSAEGPVVLVQGGSTTDANQHDELTNAWVCPLSACLAKVSSPALGRPAYLSAVASTSGTDPRSCDRIGTWVRHSIVVVSKHVLAVLGGGFTCFSFGTYSPKPQLLLLDSRTLCDDELAALLKPAEMEPPSSSPRCKEHTPPSSVMVAATNITRAVPEVTYSSMVFNSTVHCGPTSDARNDAASVPSTKAPKPKVFRNVPMGPCVEKWGRDPASIVTCGESSDANDHMQTIAVHVSKLSQPHFDFVRKNFSFRHVTVREMLHHCFGGASQMGECTTRDNENCNVATKEFWYFRSVGKNMKTDRSNFWVDFPLLAKDVVLPSGPDHRGWEMIQQNVHQSCLRINQQSMQLWTHYDTMDNVLLQIVGVKRVVLFPPDQYGNLYMKESSSRVTNIDHPDLNRFPRFADALKSAMVVELRAGDALFIPANWFHHITAVTSCIGVNIFYHRNHMKRELFDPKDLYGNKDLPRCMAFRDELQLEVVRRMKELRSAGNVPADYAQFALRQLIHDLERTADQLSATDW